MHNYYTWLPPTNAPACFLSPAMDLLRGSYGGASDGKEAEVRRRSPSPKRLRRELLAEPLITFPSASCYSSAGPPLRSSAVFEPCRRQISVQETACSSRCGCSAFPYPPSPTRRIPRYFIIHAVSSLHLVIL